MLSRSLIHNSRVPAVIFLALFFIVCAVHKPAYPPFTQKSDDQVVENPSGSIGLVRDR